MERSEELSMNQSFLLSLKDIVLSNLENEQFGAEDLAKEMGLSRSQIHRKLQKVNGKSITQFIMEIRLDIALDLLKKEVGTASEIAYKVGFSSPQYFTKCFHEHFGYTPGEAKYRISTPGRNRDEDNTEDDSNIIPIHGSNKEAQGGDYRKLTTIMFSEICGYTAIMEEREKEAILLLKRNRELHQSIIALHDGVLIKENGDVIVATFDGPTDAVRCAQKIINTAKEVENLKLHIGIHLGEIHFIDGDIYGAGVNIASGINALAKEGEVLISEEVYKNVRNKGHIYLEEVGQRKLKNIKDPIKIFNLLTNDTSHKGLRLKKNVPLIKKIFSSKRLLMVFLGVLMLLLTGYIAYQLVIKQPLSYQPVNDVKYIAVFAFEDQSPTGEQEYLGEGIAVAIINTLAKFEDLKVIGRTSSFQFRGEKVDLRAAGRKLGANYILEGSVIKVDDNIRITAQLIDLRNGTQIIWSEKFDYIMTDFFTIQDLVAEAISSKFQLTLPRGKTPTNITTAAYDYYFIGNFQMTETWNRESFEMAIKYFQEAIKIDPDFAAAYSGLAAAYIELTGWNSNVPPSEEYRGKCQEAAMKALELDPNQAEAYNVLGRIVWRFENDWNKANTYFKKGMELKPASSWAYLEYMNFLTWMGDFDKSIALGKEVIERDPLSTAAHNEHAWSYYIPRRDKEFIDQCMKTFAIDPDNYFTKLILAQYYIDQREFEKAADYAGITDGTKITIDTHPWELLTFGQYYGYSGDTIKAEECLKILNQQRQGMSVYSIESIYIYFSLGKYDEVLSIMEEGFNLDIKPPYLVQLKTLPLFDPLRDNPRFIRLVDKMKFDEYMNE